MTDLNYAPIFKPSSYSFNPTQVQNKPWQQAQMAAFNMSDHG